MIEMKVTPITAQTGQITTQTIDLGNNEQITRAIVPNADGFLALTFTRSKQFKTRTSAVNWLTGHGVVGL
jgi:hypothetical protein